MRPMEPFWDLNGQLHLPLVRADLEEGSALKSESGHWAGAMHELAGGASFRIRDERSRNFATRLKIQPGAGRLANDANLRHYPAISTLFDGFPVPNLRDPVALFEGSGLL